MNEATTKATTDHVDQELARKLAAQAYVPLKKRRADALPGYRDPRTMPRRLVRQQPASSFGSGGRATPKGTPQSKYECAVKYIPRVNFAGITHHTAKLNGITVKRARYGRR